MTREQKIQLRDAIDAHLAGKPVQWSGHDGCWYDHQGEPDFNHNTFWRPKPEPKMRPWRWPMDVPMPVCWLRCVEWLQLVWSINDRGLNSVRWDELSQYEYSTDGRTWHKCEVAEEAP